MFLPWYTQLEYLLRIILALICGGLIGLERERRVKSAGIRTHMIVAASSALMMELSKYGFWDVLSEATPVIGGKVDFSRVAAGIVSAIGFLGAGVIFTRGAKVNGVTTAAGLWSTVGMGMTFGAGLYFIGGAFTCVILLTQLLMKKRQEKKRASVQVVVRVMGTQGTLCSFEGMLHHHKDLIFKTSYEPTQIPNIYLMELNFSTSFEECKERLLCQMEDANVKFQYMEVIQ